MTRGRPLKNQSWFLGTPNTSVLPTPRQSTSEEEPARTQTFRHTARDPRPDNPGTMKTTHDDLPGKGRSPEGCASCLGSPNHSSGAHGGFSLPRRGPPLLGAGPLVLWEPEKATTHTAPSDRTSRTCVLGNLCAGQTDFILSTGNCRCGDARGFCLGVSSLPGCQLPAMSCFAPRPREVTVTSDQWPLRNRIPSTTTNHHESGLPPSSLLLRWQLD